MCSTICFSGIVVVGRYFSLGDTVGILVQPVAISSANVIRNSFFMIASPLLKN